VHVRDPVDAATEYDQDRDSPEKNDWHGCSPLEVVEPERHAVGVGSCPPIEK
jgi:hypothetical protein